MQVRARASTGQKIPRNLNEPDTRYMRHMAGVWSHTDLQAGEGGHAAAAHGRPGDSNGLWHIKHRHGSLQDARVQVHSVLGNALPEPRRVWKVLRLKLLIPPVHRVEPVLSELLIPADAYISTTLI